MKTRFTATDNAHLIAKMTLAYVGDSGRAVSVSGLEAVLAIVRPIIEREALAHAAQHVGAFITEQASQMREPTPEEIAAAILSLAPQACTPHAARRSPHE